MARKALPSLTPPEPPAQAPALPRVVRVLRSGPALHPAAVSNDPEVLALNLARGCVHRCPFCSVRGSPYYGGGGEVFVYDGTESHLAAELDSRPRRPRAVFISPATDPFPPLAELQEETVRAVAVLAGRGVESWLMTRGQIRPAALAALAAHRLRVRVTVPLTTCDRKLQRLLEPWTASPRLRLRQIAALERLGVPVQVALEPLIPGVTDTRVNLAEVLAAVAACGVRRVSATYLFLREGIADNLFAALATRGLDGVVRDAFAGGPLLTAAGLGAARFLPRPRRQRGYGLLMSLASTYGITVSVCGLTNPDFGAPRPPVAPAKRRDRLPLFPAESLA